MEQLPTPNALPPTPSKEAGSTTKSNTQNNGKNKRKPPSPEELVAHYESQGMDSKEASLKVIQDLQTIFYQTVVSGRGRKDRIMSDFPRKLDNINTRLAIVDMKLDTKPGFPEALAIGIASGALLKGIEATLPHVFGALGGMWDAVKNSTRGNPPSS